MYYSGFQLDMQQKGTFVNIYDYMLTYRIITPGSSLRFMVE